MMTKHSRRFLKQGFITGLVGAVAVAVWFLIVDSIAGRPFYTPAVLGSAATLGLRDPTEVVISLQSVGAYTAFHFLAFFAVGIVAAALAEEASRTLDVLWLAAEVFLVFEIGFYGGIAIVFTPLLGELTWINVAAGNFIASASMGFYLWRTHPEIRQQLVDAELL
jgi:hypothetical protein